MSEVTVVRNLIRDLDKDLREFSTQTAGETSVKLNNPQRGHGFFYNDYVIRALHELINPSRDPTKKHWLESAAKFILYIEYLRKISVVNTFTVAFKAAGSPVLSEENILDWCQAYEADMASYYNEDHGFSMVHENTLIHSYEGENIAKIRHPWFATLPFWRKDFWEHTPILLLGRRLFLSQPHPWNSTRYLYLLLGELKKDTDHSQRRAAFQRRNLKMLKAGFGTFNFPNNFSGKSFSIQEIR